MTIEKFIQDTFKEEHGYCFRPRIVCNDGFSMSVQGSSGHCCSPRKTQDWYNSLEIGFPSDEEPLINQFAETEDWTETVYGYVPIGIIQEVITKHGGINVNETLSGSILEQECCNIARQKKLVVLESPYAGDIELNLTYARKCLSDSLRRGESPIASHLLYTQVLNDLDPNERRQGIGAGLDWLKVADKQVFYTDLGWSEGMKRAKRAGEEIGIEIEERKIFGERIEKFYN